MKGITEKENSTTIRVTAILRLKQDLSYGCLGDGLNITEQVVWDYIQANKDSKIANYIKANPKQIPAMNMYYYADMTTQELKADMALAALGASDKIERISFYTSTFETKEKMLNYLDEWNEMCKAGGTYKGVLLTEEDEISYTDAVGIMMTMVESMLNAITYVLVAFTAISLVVSSVMIGIITYVSVVERVKEIGVLRSLGARKKDIKNLFNAETFIIGLASGLFGVAVTYLISFGVNALLGSLTGIANLASLPITSAIIMIAISVGLTLISGLIPDNAAAKKDPVVALRTE
jgi:putative ABC transport system permease protein